MIRFSRVTKTYPSGTGALRDVSFHVAKGEFVFLTGHSGAGKSTILWLISAHEAPTAGEVRVAGMNVHALRGREVPRLRRRLGMDANPWRSFSRIIASYHYVRKDDVLEQFLAACRTPEGSPHLPWDLLIVDECHNLMPSAFGEDSDLCRMLRLIAPQFEHRLFLSATPHNRRELIPWRPDRPRQNVSGALLFRSELRERKPDESDIPWFHK